MKTYSKDPVVQVEKPVWGRACAILRLRPQSKELAEIVDCGGVLWYERSKLSSYSTQADLESELVELGWIGEGRVLRSLPVAVCSEERAGFVDGSDKLEDDWVAINWRLVVFIVRFL